MQPNEQPAHQLFSILQAITVGVSRNDETATRFQDYKNAVLAEKQQEREERAQQIKAITSVYETKVTVTDDQVRKVEVTK